MATKVIVPSRAENARINRGIALDPGNPEWTDADFSRAKPARAVLPSRLYHAAVKRYRGQRGPQKTPVKQPVTLRMSWRPTKQAAPAGKPVSTKCCVARRLTTSSGPLTTDCLKNMPSSVQEPGEKTYPKREQGPKLFNKHTRGKAIQSRKKI
jgi:uncharacterized protein (DUF4415 family)